jgi:hypothetical protein
VYRRTVRLELIKAAWKALRESYFISRDDA